MCLKLKINLPKASKIINSLFDSNINLPSSVKLKSLIGAPKSTSHKISDVMGSKTDTRPDFSIKY